MTIQQHHQIVELNFGCQTMRDVYIQWEQVRCSMMGAVPRDEWIQWEHVRRSSMEVVPVRYRKGFLHGARNSFDLDGNLQP
jgi:hypothetical protein